ncbi:hypothetical protein GA0061098_1012110 [Bradyrhizobium shewense]|uniref:Uncharacterized protein n=1 Tax=Bradyrhizobium shewense TaxID=1761772 RepID=A0A1C3X5B7_9BRAD|nr:hypothetical protein GA0061098_1012110 [Bradyrhizobium shewense]
MPAPGDDPDADLHGIYSYKAQTLPCQRRHRRTARRVWRTVVLATHMSLIRVRPGPHAAATGVIMLSGWISGAGVMPWAEVPTNKAKVTTAIHLIIAHLLLSGNEGLSDDPFQSRCHLHGCSNACGAWKVAACPCCARSNPSLPYHPLICVIRSHSKTIKRESLEALADRVNCKRARHSRVCSSPTTKAPADAGA